MEQTKIHHYETKHFEQLSAQKKLPITNLNIWFFRLKTCGLKFGAASLSAINVICLSK